MKKTIISIFVFLFFIQIVFAGYSDENYNEGIFGKEPVIVTTPTTNGGGGGGSRGGGGGGAFTATLKLDEPVIKLLRVNMISRFNINNKQHTVKITEIGDGYVIVEIQSEIKQLKLIKDIGQKIDFENDSYYDIKITLKTISGRTARIEFKYINEYYGVEIINKTMPIDEVDEIIKPIEDTDLPIAEEKEESSNLFWIVIGIIFLILLIIGGIWYFVYK